MNDIIKCIHVSKHFKLCSYKWSINKINKIDVILQLTTFQCDVSWNAIYTHIKLIEITLRKAPITCEISIKKLLFRSII